jgi:pimeloyl-ACP methyl ester carboxylesterase
MAQETTATSNDVIVSKDSITKPGKLECRVSVPIPLPNIVILVHGVNDAGEAYSAQEQGICAGLNHRLNRSQTEQPDDKGDLRGADYNIPPPNPPLVPDPDAVFYRRKNEGAVSPVIPFYWGFREEEEMLQKDLWHGQWTDRFGTRVDKNGAKEGGPFANASNNLNAFWGHGFTGQVMNSTFIANKGSTPLHDLREAMPRYYMLLAGKRLAMLIRLIKAQEKYKDCAVNLVCHSQGGMLALLAHAILQDEAPSIAADTVILQNPPYSLEEPEMERSDGVLEDLQQTTQSRVTTLANLVNYIGKSRVTAPSLHEVNDKYSLCTGLYGPHWQAGAGAKQWIAVDGKSQECRFTERDNRGKIYLYFCPYDATVALRNVQGIGWKGVPEVMDAETGAISPADDKPIFNKIDVLSQLDGSAFRQRVFTERKVDGKPELVGTAPHQYKLRSSLFESSPTGGLASESIAVGTERLINGEELNPPLLPNLRLGEDAKGHLQVGPIDAMIALASKKDNKARKTVSMPDDRQGGRQGMFPLTPAEIEHFEGKLEGQRPSTTAQDKDKRLRIIEAEKQGKWINITHSTETIDEARVRWQRDTDENSHHSAIPANALHAERVTAYDLSLGAPLPQKPADAAFMAYFRAVADWRIDWEEMRQSTSQEDIKLLALLSAEKSAEFQRLIHATNLYYLTGKLPESIAKAGQVTMLAPTSLVSQTRKDRSNGSGPEYRANPSLHKRK